MGKSPHRKMGRTDLITCLAYYKGVSEETIVTALRHLTPKMRRSLANNPKIQAVHRELFPQMET